MLRYFYFGDNLINKFFDDATFTLTSGNIYNPKTHDLIPKPDFLDREIKYIEDEIAQNERNFDSSKKYYEGERKRLEEKKERLVAQRGKKR